MLHSLLLKKHSIWLRTNHCGDCWLQVTRKLEMMIMTMVSDI